MSDTVRNLLLNTSCEDIETSAICVAEMWLWLVLPVSLLLVGLIGNSINLIVLSRKNIRGRPISILLMCLAVSDATFLVSATMRNLVCRLFQLDVVDWSTVTCTTYEWVTYVSSGMSVWLLVLWTIERTLLLATPTNARRLINGKTTGIAISITFFAILLLTGHLLFGFEIRTFRSEIIVNGSAVIAQEDTCSFVSKDYESFHGGFWSVIVLVGFVIVPSSIIFLGNGFIMYKLWSRNRQVLPVLANGRRPVDERERSATKLLIGLCVFFFVTTSPYSLFLVVLERMLQDEDSLEQRAMYRLGYVLTFSILLCNFTFNFCLYFVSSVVFKREWRSMMRELLQWCTRVRTT